MSLVEPRTKICLSLLVAWSSQLSIHYWLHMPYQGLADRAATSLKLTPFLSDCNLLDSPLTTHSSLYTF